MYGTRTNIHQVWTNFHNERGSINIPRPVTESHRNSRVWGYIYRALCEQYAFRGEDTYMEMQKEPAV